MCDAASTGPKLGVVVANQVLCRHAERCGFAQVLRHSDIGRMSGGIDVYDAPRSNVHDYEDVQFRQLAADPFGSPQAVFARRALDQRDRLGAQPIGRFVPARFEPPKQAKALATLAQHASAGASAEVYPAG